MGLESLAGGIAELGSSAQGALGGLADKLPSPISGMANKLIGNISNRGGLDAIKDWIAGREGVKAADLASYVPPGIQSTGPSTLDLIKNLGLSQVGAYTPQNINPQSSSTNIKNLLSSIPGFKQGKQQRGTPKTIDTLGE